MRIMLAIPKMMLASLVLHSLIVMVPPRTLAAEKKVFILHSYHQTSEWTDSIMQGMMGVLDESGMELEIYVEYMDVNRHPLESAYARMDAICRIRYNEFPFDVVLLSDQDALNFFLSRREAFFQGVPMVFCGINNFREEMLQGQRGITGINQDIDIKGTIALARRINPDIRKFLVINDRTATGLTNREKYKEYIAGLYGDAPSFDFMDDFTLQELRARLGGLSRDSAVLVMRLHQTKEGRMLSPSQYLKLITDGCEVPVFKLWGPYFEDDTLGGGMVSGRTQGENAAKYAMRILGGEPLSSIPVMMESPNVSMVDWRQLERFNISKKAIPQGTLVLHEPESLFYVYRFEILVVVSVISLLVIMVIALFSVIVVRRKSERVLQESEDRLSASHQILDGVLSHTHIMAAFLDPQFKFIWVNQAYADNCRRPPSFFPGKNYFDIYPVAKNRLYFKRVVDTGEPFFTSATPFEFPHQPERGLMYWDWSLVPVRNDAGEVSGLVLTLDDVTDRILVREAQELFKYMFESSPLAMVISNASDHRFVEVNDAFVTTTGYAKEEVIGKTTTDLDLFPDLIPFNDTVEALRTEGRFVNTELPVRRKDGAHITGLFSGTIISRKGRRLILTVMADITERKRLEQQLQQAQKMESIGILAGGIAHDFNNLLFPIVGMSEILMTDLPAGSVERENTEEIHKAGLRGADLVKQILAFSRQTEHRMAPVRIQQVLKGAMKLIRATIPSDIDIVQDIQKDCGLVLADAVQIHQVVMNLMTNALHAVEERGGHISIALKEVAAGDEEAEGRSVGPGQYACLSVSDTGCGMAPSVLKKIFDPYFTTKEKGKGTGLGLAVVYGIVKEHNGDIRVVSQPGEGTTVDIFFPSMGKTTHKPIDPEVDIACMTGDEHILLVDDEGPVVRLQKQLLELLGYRVTAHTDSEAAIKEFKELPDDFDLVMTDMAMPKITGDRLAREVMSIKPDVPVIICTGFSERMDQAKADAMGVKGLLMKPVSKSEIANTVRNALDEKKNKPKMDNR